MNNSKRWAIVFLLFSLAAISETVHIFTSHEKNIVETRAEMMPLSLLLVTALIIATAYLWRKGNKNP